MTIVFPARAGMIRGSGSPTASGLGIPRESGDDPGRTLDITTEKGYSPRERG